MLREIKDVAQKAGESRRRWFSGAEMDLFVWIDADEKIVAYQLAYDKHHAEKALIWSADGGVKHMRVDGGERPSGHPVTPLLVPDDNIDPERLMLILAEQGGAVDAWIRHFIVASIEQSF